MVFLDSEVELYIRINWLEIAFEKDGRWMTCLWRKRGRRIGIQNRGGMAGHSISLGLRSLVEIHVRLSIGPWCSLFGSVVLGGRLFRSRWTCGLRRSRSGMVFPYRRVSSFRSVGWYRFDGRGASAAGDGPSVETFAFVVDKLRDCDVLDVRGSDLADCNRHNASGLLTVVQQLLRRVCKPNFLG